MSKLATRWRNFFRPGNDLFGYVLLALSMVLWFEGNNLRSLNIFMGIVVIFWFTVHLLSKTKLFSKKESDLKTPSLKRKFKLFSFIIVILVALLVLSTGIVINVLEDFGGEPSNHDSPNFKDGVFENLQTTGGQSENGSTWDLLGGYMVSDDCRSPNEELRSEKYEIYGLEDDEISITWFGLSTVLIR